LDGATKRPLSFFNWATDTKKVKLTDYETLTVLLRPDVNLFSITYNSYDENGELLDVTNTLVNALNSSILSDGSIGNYANMRLNIPVGPMNLGLVPDTKYYTVKLNGPGDAQLGPLLRFNVVCDDLDFRMAFLNRLGAFEYASFRLVEDSIETERLNYQKELGYGYTSKDRGFKTYAQTSEVTYRLISDKLNKTEAEWMFNLLESNAIYRIMPDGSARPLVMKTNAAKKFLERDAGVKVYEIVVSDAHKKGSNV
jgi:hypothetical protein